MLVNEIINYNQVQHGLLLDKPNEVRNSSLHNHELGIGVLGFYILLNELTYIVSGKFDIFDLRFIWNDTRKFPKEVNCPLTP